MSAPEPAIADYLSDILDALTAIGETLAEIRDAVEKAGPR